MKKILQCGLFMLMVSGFINAHAADLNRLGSSSSSLSSSIIVTEPNANSSNSQSTAVSPMVDAMLRNINLIAADWTFFVRRDFNVIPCPFETLNSLNTTFQIAQRLPEEQVSILAKGAEAASEKDDNGAYEYALRGVKLVKELDKTPLSELRKTDIKFLAKMMIFANLIPRINNAYYTLYNRALLENDIDEESLTVLLDFVRNVRNGPHPSTWIFFQRTLEATFPGLNMFPQVDRNKVRKVFPAFYLLRDLLEVSRPRSVSCRIWPATIADIKISVLGGNNEDSSLLKPCRIVFGHPGLCLKEDDIRSFEAKLLAMILFHKGVVRQAIIDSIDRDFQFPSPQNNVFDCLCLRPGGMSYPATVFLSECGEINELEIEFIQEWQNYGFFRSVIQRRHEDGRIKKISCTIFKEHFGLLQWIVKSMPEALQKIYLDLDRAERGRWFDMVSEVIAISESLGIKKQTRRCIIPACRSDWPRDVDRLGYLLTKWGVDELLYIVMAGQTFDPLMSLMPRISLNLNKMRIRLPDRQQDVDAAKNVLKSVFDYCHNVREITSVGRVLESSPDVLDPYRVMLHPFMNSESKDVGSFVRWELNKLRYAGKADINLNELAEKKKGWYQVAEGDPLNNCIALLKGIISNKRGSREKIATIMKVLSALKIDNVGLRLLSEKIAKHYAFWADDVLPKLMRVPEFIRRKCYVQPLQVDNMMKARAVLANWYKWFENERNIFYPIDPIKDAIAEMIRVLPNEDVRAELKSINVDKIFAPIMAQYRDCLILFQNVCYLTDRMTKEFSNDELQKILAVAQRKH